MKYIKLFESFINETSTIDDNHIITTYPQENKIDGKYLTLFPHKNGMVIELTEKGKKEIERKGHSIELFTELFRDVNEYDEEYVFHQNIRKSDLISYLTKIDMIDYEITTDAPSISYGFYHNHVGEWEFGEGSVIYIYNDNHYNDIVKNLYKNGKIYFNRFPF